MSTAGASGAAHNASADTTRPPDREYARRLADDAEKAVKVIQAKYDGIKESLTTAKADAKRLRAEAEGA